MTEGPVVTGRRTVFFVSLVVLAPLVIVLVGFVRREGIWPAGALMVLDVCGNWWGNRHLLPWWQETHP
ncbi:hypothetical protein [Streptomyces griseoluteus]